MLDFPPPKSLAGLQATGAEIDGAVSDKPNYVFGDSLYDTSVRKPLLDLTRWSIQSNGTGTPVFDNVSTYHKFGSLSFRFGNTTAGDSTVTGKKINLTSAIDLSGVATFTFWIYVDGRMVSGDVTSSAFGTVLFVVGDLNFANAKATNIFGAGGGAWHRGWNNITVNKADFSTTIAGTINWANIQSMQIRLDPNASNDGTTFFHIDSVFFGGTTKQKIPVCITLDDSHKDSIVMTEIMNKYGIPVSLFVIPDFVDNRTTYPDYMSIDEISALYKRGNHIGFHHQDTNAFVTDSLNIKNGIQWLSANGFTRDNGHLYGSYPNGTYSQTVINDAIVYGAKSIRSLVGVSQNTTVGNEASTGIIYYESVLNGGIADPFRINSHKPANTATLTTNLTQAINKKAAYLTYHHLTSEVGGVTEWENMAKYLKTKIDDGTIECLTYPQFVKKYT